MSGFQLLKQVFAFPYPSASKAGTGTTLTLLPRGWPDTVPSAETGPDQVLLHPSQLQSLSLLGCPEPKGPELQALWGLRLSPLLSPLHESCCYFCRTSLLSAGAAGLKLQGGSVPQGTTPRWAGLPWRRASSLSSGRGGAANVPPMGSLGSWQTQALPLRAHIHAYACDTCMCMLCVFLHNVCVDVWMRCVHV